MRRIGNESPSSHYRKIGYKFYDRVKDVAQGIMKEACDEVRSLSTGSYTEEDNSIIMYYYLDLEVMSRYCQYCVKIEVYKRDDIVLYDKLKHDHICSINLWFTSQNVAIGS